MYQDFFKVTQDCVFPKYIIERFDKTATEFLIMLNDFIQNEEGVLHQNKIYIAKTAKEWAKLLILSERTIRRITKTLIEKNAIDVLKLSSDPFKRTNYITILYENL
jgi:hypothetical protein